jgi:hypothetical protein
MRLNRRSLAAILLLVSSGCSRLPADDPRVPAEWMHILYGAVRAERLSPPVASRIFAYAGVAMYAGMSAADPKLPPITGRLNGLEALPAADGSRRYDRTLTAIAAERVVLDSLFREGLPTTRASLRRVADSLENARVKSGVSKSIATSSEELGLKTGLAILAWAHGDGFDSTRGRKYVLPTGPGLWVNDTPDNTLTPQNLSAATQLIVPSNPANAMKAGAANDRGLILDRQKKQVKTLPAVNMAGVTEPYWGYNRPFALTGWNECPAPPPPAYDTKPGTPLYDDAKQVYDIHAALTPEQKKIALYWADNGGETGTPAGHWLAIAGQMVSEKHLQADEAAWLMAATGVSLADAFIAAWGYKFKLNLIRPRTFIRRTMDPNWEPFIPTPPFPEYLSGHSTLSAAAAGVLTGVLGNVSFEDSTSVPLGHDVRKFASFQAAAEEAGMSRIYGGIHFPSGNVEGRKLGACVAGKVLARFNGGRLR